MVQLLKTQIVFHSFTLFINILIILNFISNWVPQGTVVMYDNVLHVENLKCEFFNCQGGGLGIKTTVGDALSINSASHEY